MKEIWWPGGIATLIPVSNPNLSHEKGIFVGRNIFTNSPIYVDTFCGPPTLPNPHTFICRNFWWWKKRRLKNTDCEKYCNGRMWSILYRRRTENIQI